MSNAIDAYLNRLNAGQWEDKNGNRVYIEDMTTPHIEQCIGYIRRRRKHRPFYMGDTWIKLFQLELLRRNNDT